MPIQYNTKQRQNPFAPNPVQTVPDQLAAKLGSGLLAPLNIVNNSWQVATGITKVQQDIWVTLSTAVGSRMNQLDFGSMLPYLIFEDYNANLRQEILIATQTALNTWVTSIIVQAVQIDDSNIDQNYLVLTLQYMLKGTNSSQTLTIALAGPDVVQLPPSTFVLNGVPFLKA